MRSRMVRVIILWAVFSMSVSYAVRAGNGPEERLRCSLETVQKTMLASRHADRRIQTALRVVVPGRYERETLHSVIYGSTPAELLKAEYQVGHGVVCCRPDDVKSVNGLDTDFARNKYWVVSVNGSAQVSPNNTILEEGDVVEWRYHEDDAFPKALLNSDKWV